MNPEEYQVLEESFNPSNLEEIKDNKNYHHSCKGCDVIMIVEKNQDSRGANWSIKKYCNTHEVMCSKSGWKLGWYQGKRTKDIYDPSGKNHKFNKCECGKRYKENGLGMCKWCHKEKHPELITELEIEKKKIAAYRATYRNKKIKFMDNGHAENVAKELAKKWMDENYK